ncbi:MAG: hypothetical protein ACRCWI_04665 [Brevinema sp.]
MNFSLKLSLHLLIWALIFGFVSGIFGISSALIQIADFYLQEGTQQATDIYNYRISNTDKNPLNDNVITELQNIQGTAFVDPYFKPTNQVIGSINYFGFSASNAITLSGIPKRQGIKKASQAHQSQWNSADLSSIPVLLPQQAISLYNNLAPQRSWPSLPESSFIGLPGVELTINTNSVRAIISGFDPDEFGTTITAPSEKLYAFFNSIGLNPTYDYLILETVPGLTKKQNRELLKSIEDLGYQTTAAREDNFQQELFMRIKYTIMIFGISILIAFIFLLHYNIQILLRPLRERLLLYRIWAVKDHLILKTSFFSTIFAFLAGMVSWIVCFFAVIPAQSYIIDTLSKFGINTPPLKDTVRISLETALICMLLYLSINLITVIYFYYNIPKASYIKKF